MTFTVRVYSAARADENNNTITLTQRGSVSDVLAPGKKNKHFHTCDFSSAIDHTFSAGELLFLGFEFTCTDNASITFGGGVKVDYTLFAKTA